MQTFTFTGTATYSVADVKAVMQNTFEDIVGFANRGMILDPSFDNAKKWIDDLTFLLNQKILRSFELQIYHNLMPIKAYRYDVEMNGYISTGSQSGGIDFFSFPEGAKVFLFADLDESDYPKYQRVMEELHKRGWGTRSPMNGTATLERTYASNSLQLKRSVINK